MKTSSFATRPARAVRRQPVRVVTKSCYKAGIVARRILVHISRGEHRALEPDNVYYLLELREIDEMDGFVPGEISIQQSSESFSWHRFEFSTLT
jgi:hypothetical protein